MIIEILMDWQQSIKRADAFLEASAPFIGEGSAFYDEIAQLQDALTRSVSLHIGDKYQFLRWHWLENDFGEKGLSAGVNGEFTYIKTLEDLAAIIGKVNSHNLTVTKWKV